MAVGGGDVFAVWNRVLDLIPPHACSGSGRPRPRTANTPSVHGFDTLLRDDAALHFVGTEPAEAWTIREGATACRVEPGSETPLPARLL